MTKVVPVGGEIVVNTTTTDGQGSPSIAAINGGPASLVGGVVVAWSDSSGDGTIKAQIFAPDGQKFGGELLVNTNSGGTQQHSVVASLGNGNFVVAWSDNSGVGGDASGHAVKAQVFSATGAKIGGEFLVNTTTTGDQGSYNQFDGSASITALSGNRFIVTWGDRSGLGADTSGTGVKGQIFDSTGGRIGGEFLLNTTTANSQFLPVISELANGGFVATWIDYSQSQVQYQLTTQVFDPSGAKIGGEIAVATAGSGAAVTGLAGGGFVIAWSGFNGSTGSQIGDDIKAQIFDASGAKVGGVFVANSTNALEQENPAVTGLPGGGFVVTWWSPSLHEIRGQLFDAAGVKAGDEFQVDQDYDVGPPEVVSSAGGFTIVWAAYSATASSYDIKAHRYAVTSAVDAVNENVVFEEDAAATSVNVLANDSGATSIAGFGPITVSGPIADLDASDVNVTIDGSSLIVDLGSDFDKLTDGQYASVVIPYVATNGSTSDGATLKVTVAGKAGPVTAPADANPASNYVLENSAIGTLVGITAQSINSDAGGTVTYRLVTSPTQNTAFAIDRTTGVITVAGPLDADSQPTRLITVEASAGSGAVARTTFTVTIGDINEPPRSFDDSYAVRKNATLHVAAAGVLANEYDLEGEPLTALLVSGPTHGTLTLNANGSFDYTPAANYTGDDSFTYKNNDGVFDSPTATVRLTISNTAPVATADSYATTVNAPLVVSGSGVLANDADANGDALTAILDSGPAHGSLALNADGSFTYTPQADYFGADSFSYRARDGQNASSAAATVSISVARQAFGDTLTTNEDTAGTVNVLTNDTFGTGATITGVTQGAHGTVTNNNDGTLTFTPVADYFGTDTFTYTAIGATGAAETATVSLTVTAVNDAPVLNDVPAGAAYSSGAVLVLAPDLTLSDVDSATLTSATVHVSAGAFAAHGDVLSVSADGLAGTSIVASYDATTETLTLSGTDTLAHYAQALEHVAFQTTNFGFDRAQAIEWQVDDGSTANNLSAVETTAINMPRQQNNDFGGNGQSGILWQHTDGTVAIWSMNGTSLVSGASVAFNPGPSWHAIGTGDFDGDGKADILWQNADGTPAIWLMDGTNILSGANVGFNPGPSWHVIGSGDFDGDGKADVLWQNQNGQAAVWLMDGQTVKSGSDVGPNPGPSWHAIGSGDFDGDGKADILWQNQNGQAAVWLMDGLNLKSGSDIGTNPGPSWHVIGSGDFDGDGKADILWQNANGQAAVWMMNGQSLISGNNVGINPGPAWQVHGTGDFNGDGKADIEWQNTDGTPAVWLMDGYNVVAGSNVGFNPGANWHEIPPHHDALV